MNGALSVGADYSVSPVDGVVFSDERPLPGHAYSNGTYVYPGTYRGAVAISAAHAHDKATLRGYVYDTMRIDCDMDSRKGSAIYQENSPPPAAGLGCPQTLLHVPYGGTLLRGPYIGDVSASAWRHDFTIVPQLRSGDILLFKTELGTVVKCLISMNGPGEPAAAYISTISPRGEFGDYLAWHSKRKTPK